MFFFKLISAILAYDKRWYFLFKNCFWTDILYLFSLHPRKKRIVFGFIHSWIKKKSLISSLRHIHRSVVWLSSSCIIKWDKIKITLSYLIFFETKHCPSRCYFRFRMTKILLNGKFNTFFSLKRQTKNVDEYLHACIHLDIHKNSTRPKQSVIHPKALGMLAFLFYYSCYLTV